MQQNKSGAFLLGICIFLGLATLGYFIQDATVKFKQYDRVVTVKGLSQKEFKADIVIWPIKFQVASNELENLYDLLDENSAKIESFLLKNGIKKEEISRSAPSITDKSAQQYSNAQKPKFRYTASQIVTVYSKNIDTVRALKSSLSQLGKEGIVIRGNDYEARTEYLFTRLNEVKPSMIEEATKNARAVALKFAEDSDSKLGKIKRASQGQFSITQRDKNNPHIKKVRVVCTVQYYLSD
jgi:uncharacterized protein